jgi:hypothetical protein
VAGGALPVMASAGAHQTRMSIAEKTRGMPAKHSIKDST